MTRLAGALFVGTLAAAANAAPKADLWERWTAHAPNAAATIDHDPWDAFLARYVQEHADGVNRIPYARVTPEDKTSLEAYLARLSDVRISEYSRDEQLPYWINLYNALTVKVVLDHYPVASIREISISPGFFSVGPWKKKLVRVEGEELSLDDIEHRILRPIWKDPRIHYAVNCAAIGCPNLMQRAYTAANAEAALERGARDYVNHPRGARLEGGSRLVVSSIYEWFQEDFGGTEAGVIAHLRRYADPELDAELAQVDAIRDDEYDWALNDAEPVREPHDRRAGSTSR